MVYCVGCGKPLRPPPDVPLARERSRGNSVPALPVEAETAGKQSPTVLPYHAPEVKPAKPVGMRPAFALLLLGGVVLRYYTTWQRNSSPPAPAPPTFAVPRYAPPPPPNRPPGQIDPYPDIPDPTPRPPTVDDLRPQPSVPEGPE
jgi:hypothetical protein